MVTRGPTDEVSVLLAALPPSEWQHRLAFAIITVFVVAFALTVPYANAPLPRIDVWIPCAATALVINDLITSTLLFSQFSIARRWALLALAVGYLFSGLMVIPYALMFPGVFSPTGLLGAGLQSTVWLYVIWHTASPLSVIVYELFKGANEATSVSQGSVRRDVGLSIAITIAVVGALTWFVTAHHDLLPLIYLDSKRLAPLANIAGGFVFLTCGIALALLWVRRGSVLDLWLMVTVTAWLLEITLQGLFLTDRYSLAWYMGRIYSITASGVVLLVFLSETTVLYAHLARSFTRQRTARQARQIAMDTMAASIAHEVNQPLGAIAANAEAALVLLAKSPPNNDEVRAALNDIAAATARGSQVIAGLRAIFKKSVTEKVSVDINDLVREVLAMLDINLRTERVLISTALDERLPRPLADRVQLQQVLLNLIMNAIEAMRTVPDRQRRLRIRSEVDRDSSEIRLAVEDTGVGIGNKTQDVIFEPFFTTKPAGMGIGLTVCRSIIDAHGGSLSASLNRPYGTIFEVVLPTGVRERA